VIAQPLPSLFYHKILRLPPSIALPSAPISTDREFEDDGLSSDDVDGQEGEASDDEDGIEPKSFTPGKHNVFAPRAHLSSSDLTPTPSPTATSLPPTQQAKYFLPSIPKILTRCPVCHTTLPTRDRALNPNRPRPCANRASRPRLPEKGRKVLGCGMDRQVAGLSLTDNGIMGIVMLEIHSATDLCL